MKGISTPDFHQQRKCETHSFNSTDKYPRKESEMMCNKSDCSSLEEKLTKNILDAESKKTYLEINDFSEKAKFSVNTIFLPVSKKTYRKENEKSEGKLTESLSFPEVATQPENKSRSLVDKVSKSIESTKDANTVLRTSESNSEFITTPNRRFDSDLASREFAFKHKTDNNASNTNEKTYECDKCKEKCFNRTSFIRHYKSHSSKNLIVCGNSQKVSSHEDQLERKERTDTLEKPFACNRCEKRFTHSYLLNTHYRTHTIKTSIVCNICKKTFKRKWHLAQHYRTHTKEKPFVCEICEKGFTQKSSLKTHYGMHNNEKPFVCDICGKGFVQKSYLDIHERTHTGEKPYACDICEKRFNHKSNLVRHHRAHTGEME